MRVILGVRSSPFDLLLGSTETMALPERRHVFYSGHVQGVGFRYTAARIASGFRVTGFVRNLPDGRVELVAEGEPEELTGFLDRLAASMERNVTDAEVRGGQAIGEFSDFDIRF